MNDNEYENMEETVILGDLTYKQLQEGRFVLIKEMCGWYYVSRSQTMEEKRRYNGDLSGVQTYANMGCPTCDGENKNERRCDAYYPVSVGYRKIDTSKPFNDYGAGI